MARWMLVAAMTLGMTGLALMPACSMAKHAEKGESEVKVKLEECPKAVQETIKKEVAGGKIEDITKENEKGKNCYEVDAEIGGKDYEIKVSEDGSLISKKLEDEKEEGDKKEEKGQHEDKK